MSGYFKRVSSTLIVVLIIATPVLVRPTAAGGQTTRPAEEPLPLKIERRIFIAAPLERVWQALHDPKISDDWFPFPLAHVELKVGGQFKYLDAESPQIVCEVLELNPRRRLSLSFDFRSGPETIVAEPPTRLTYELRAWGPSTELRLVHDQFEQSPLAARTSGRIWDSNLSRLKTLLETGKPLVYSFEEAREMAGHGQELGPDDRINPLAYLRAITLFVADLKTARPWYEEVFNLSLSGFSQDWITLSMARPAITIKEARKAGERPGQALLSFRAADVERLYRRLQGQGVKFTQPLTPLKYVKEFTFEGPGGFRFFVRGPAEPPPGLESAEATATQPAAEE